MQELFVIELSSDLDNYDPKAPNPNFFDDTWGTIERHSEKVKAIYEFKRRSNQSWFTLWFKKKEKQEFPKIESLGGFNGKSNKEIRGIRYATLTGHYDIFYEVEDNEIVIEMLAAYNYEFSMTRHFLEHFEQEELDVLNLFFEQIDERSKLVIFGHDGNPVIIIFFSENSFKEVKKIIGE